MAKTIGYQEVAVRDLVSDPSNVRRRTTEIGDLEEDIKSRGILEPLIVRRRGGKFAVVIGSRRFAAAKAVGLKTVPVILKELSDEEAFIESAVENIQRETLDPSDELAVVAGIHKTYPSVTEVSRILAKSKSWVEDHLRVLGFVENVRKSSGTTGRSPPVEVPRDIRKVAGIVRAAEAVYDEPKKRADLFEELKNKPREQVDRTVRRLRAIAEEDPERVSRKPVKEVISEVMAVDRLELTLEFSTPTTKAVMKASRARGISEEDVVTIAVEDWLKRQHFL